MYAMNFFDCSGVFSSEVIQSPLIINKQVVKTACVLIDALAQ
jgi:hypothetical protein